MTGYLRELVLANKETIRVCSTSCWRYKRATKNNRKLQSNKIRSAAENRSFSISSHCLVFNSHHFLNHTPAQEEINNEVLLNSVVSWTIFRKNTEEKMYIHTHVRMRYGNLNKSNLWKGQTCDQKPIFFVQCWKMLKLWMELEAPAHVKTSLWLIVQGRKR